MKIIQEYQKYLSSVNKSVKTIETYTYNLQDFFKFICVIKHIDVISNIILFNIEKKDVINYFVYLLYEKENKVATRSVKLTSLKVFFTWLLINNPEKDNPTEGLAPFVKVKRIPRALNMSQAKEIQNIYSDKRNNLIIKILLQTGIRLNELSNIKISKIDISNKTMTVLGKGNKDRIVFLNEKLAEAIKEYIGNSNRKYLFEGNSNGHISNRAVQYIVEKAYKRMRVEGFTTHSLRHTCATVLYQQTKDILLVQKILGHDSLLSTQIYIHVIALEIKESIERNPLSDFEVQERRVM